MGGFIELYKIDKVKIKENLYPKISDTSLPDVFVEGINESFGTFQNFLNSQNNDPDLSYESLLTKLQKENYTLENSEFTVLFDWFTWYYQNDHQGDEEIFAHHGFISIWALNTRYEVPLLFSATPVGIEQFYLPLLPFDYQWNQHGLLSSDNLLLMVDYLILLSFKAAVFKESPDVEEMRNYLNISQFDGTANLHTSTEKHLEAHLQGKIDECYRREIEHLLEGGYDYIPDIMLNIKEKLKGYKDPIYFDHND